MADILGDFALPVSRKQGNEVEAEVEVEKQRSRLKSTAPREKRKRKRRDAKYFVVASRRRPWGIYDAKIAVEQV